MAYTTIDDPGQHFKTVIYTGDGNNGRTVTGVGFQPDWVWIKGRSESEHHTLNDSVRGANKQVYSHLGYSEATDTDRLQSFDSDGFTLGTDVIVNKNSETFVSWNWKLADSNANNTDGDINSVVRANTTSGVAIVTYTGNATSGQGIGHGLGIAPKFVTMKNRDQADDWIIFTNAIDGSMDYIQGGWQSTGTKQDSGLDVPTTSVFDVHSDSYQNATGEDYVAYCIAPVQGFSKIGVYKGNNNANGNFVYLGFTPEWVLVKDTASGQSWHIIDSVREPFNDGDAAHLIPNKSNSEAASKTERGTAAIDLLSNGFKIRSDGSLLNGTGTLLYIAFAGAPLVNSKGVPANAR